MRQPFGLFSMTLHDFPGHRPISMTLKAWKIWILNSMTFQDLYARWRQEDDTKDDKLPVLCCLLAGFAVLTLQLFSLLFQFSFLSMSLSLQFHTCPFRSHPFSLQTHFFHPTNKKCTSSKEPQLHSTVPLLFIPLIYLHLLLIYLWLFIYKKVHNSSCNSRYSVVTALHMS